MYAHAQPLRQQFWQCSNTLRPGKQSSTWLAARFGSEHSAGYRAILLFQFDQFREHCLNRKLVGITAKQPSNEGIHYLRREFMAEPARDEVIDRLFSSIGATASQDFGHHRQPGAWRQVVRNQKTERMGGNAVQPAVVEQIATAHVLAELDRR